MNDRIYTKEYFLQKIGEVSAVFATLDLFVTGLIYKLFSARKVDELNVKDNTTLGRKVAVLRQLEEGDISQPGIFEELTKILPDLERVSKERNRYLHDQWIFDDSTMATGEIDRIRIKRKAELNINVFDFENSKFKIEDLNKFCAEILSLQNEVKNISDKVPQINRDFLEVEEKEQGTI